MILSRRLVLTGLAALAAAPAAAQVAIEQYVKLPPIAVEYWDQAGLFHMVHVTMAVAFREEAKLDKTAAEGIQNALSAMTWEDLAKGNPAATIKTVALDVIRKHKGGEKAVEVLITKMVIR